MRSRCEAAVFVDGEIVVSRSALDRTRRASAKRDVHRTQRRVEAGVTAIDDQSAGRRIECGTGGSLQIGADGHAESIERECSGGDIQHAARRDVAAERDRACAIDLE